MPVATQTTASTNGHAPHTLPLELISLPADNPRRKVGDVTELAASIAAVGLLEPLVVTPLEDDDDGGGRYLLVCGSRRYTAAAQLGLVEAPVVIRQLEERERREAMLIENLQREDLSVLEESVAYQGLVDLGLSQRELASRVGRSQSHLSKRLALLKLPEPVRRSLDSGGITLEDAQELLKLADMPKRLAKAFADGKRGSIAHCVRMQLEEHKTAQRIGSETERLKRAGVRLLSPARDTYGYQRLPKGSIEISRDGGYDTLKLDPRKHAKEPCHAAVVMDRWGTVKTLYVCTERQRHPDLKTGSERASGRNSDHTKNEREKQRRQREAARERTEFIRKLLQDRTADDVALEQALAGFLDVSQQDVLRKGCELLDLEPRQTKTSYGAIQRDYTGPLRDLIAGGKTQRQRLALALGLAAVETRMESQWIQWGQRESTHLDFLAKHGYTISTAERARLPKKRAARAKTSEAST